jgi:tripartite-type tricarboxylate transporter receptor subunit TctC
MGTGVNAVGSAQPPRTHAGGDARAPAPGLDRGAGGLYRRHWPPGPRVTAPRVAGRLQRGIMRSDRRRFLRLAGAAATAPFVSRRAFALEYPTRPVRIVVPFGPGGPTDVYARIVGQKLTEQLGRQFYVENIAGGGGNTGTAQVARSTPDGHTILFTVSAFVTNPAFQGKAPYDPVKDFAPVAVPVASAIALVSHPSFAVKTVAELVALDKANPGKYAYASGGVGAQPHLTFEKLRLSLGLDIVHVPFTGAGPAVAAIVGNVTPVGISSLPPCVPHLMEGNLRGLVLTSRTRSTKLPDIPTAAEAGYPIMEGDQWLGVLAPAGTPAEIVALLHRKLVEITVLPDVKQRLDALDFIEVTSTSEQFAAQIKAEMKSWTEVSAKIRPG